VAAGAAHPAGLAPGRYVRLAVADTGAGMPPEVLARVTEPFFTTKPRGKGTGLGLAMARGFAEQSGGGLGVESAPGRGTVVTLWLPAAGAGAPSSAAAGAAAPAGAGAAGAARPARVLLVDDDTMVREPLAADLAAAGHTVLAAEGGAEALDLLEAGAAGEPVDVLVTDLAMPGMSGLALIREAQARRPILPAVLLTGYAEDGAALAPAAEGARFLLLRKPIDVAALAGRIATLLEAPASEAPAG